jgi:hypothetical protein
MEGSLSHLHTAQLADSDGRPRGHVGILSVTSPRSPVMISLRVLASLFLVACSQQAIPDMGGAPPDSAVVDAREADVSEIPDLLLAPAFCGVPDGGVLVAWGNVNRFGQMSGSGFSLIEDLLGDGTRYRLSLIVFPNGHFTASAVAFPGEGACSVRNHDFRAGTFEVDCYDEQRIPQALDFIMCVYP